MEAQHYAPFQDIKMVHFSVKFKYMMFNIMKYNEINVQYNEVNVLILIFYFSSLMITSIKISPLEYFQKINK